MNEFETGRASAMTEETLAALGGDEIAYVKPVMSDDIKALFPRAPDMAPGILLFALHAADGTPIMLTDNRDAAIAEALQNDLEAVSVH